MTKRKGVIWCFTPNPVLEHKFRAQDGRATITAGGKGHNVARQLALWGCTARSVICGSTSDSTSNVREWLSRARGDGVGVRMIPGVGGRVRRGWAWVGLRGGDRLDFFEADPHISLAGWTKIRKFWLKILKKGDWWVVAGSAPQGWPKTWWRNLFRDLKKKGVRLVVDSRGPILREALQAQACWVKCNLGEAEETWNLRGIASCFQAMAKNSSPQSSQMITTGQKGLWIRQGEKTLQFAAPRVRVQDATGSGDAVTALLLFAEMGGWALSKLGRAAVKVGAENAKCGEPGRVARSCFRG